MRSVRYVPFLCGAAVALVVSTLDARPAHARDWSEFAAPEDKALLVFIQNVYEDRTMTFVVFRADRQCVAEVGGRQARLVPMEPGEHTLYVTGYGTERIELHLEAARTYFVRLHTVERAFARKSVVTPVRRGTESYMQLRTSLDGAHLTHAGDDSCRGKPLKERKKRTARRIVEGDADWNEGGAPYQAEHTLREQDGFTERELEAMTMERL